MNDQTKTSPQRLITSSVLLGVGLAIIMIVPSRAIGGPTSSGGDRSSLHRSAAYAAHTLNATDEAHLHYIHSSGSVLIETGTVTGTLPGSMNAHVSIGATISGTFTINVHGGGSIKGHGSGIPSGSGTYESFRGSLMVTSGTGRYTHAHGHAKLYGTFNRKTYALVVQTAGHLSY
jgi:hypothetical protein